MKDDSVELRLLKPARQVPSDLLTESEPGFGIFRLRQQQSTCGF
jgi:hypothetical protein